MKYKRGRWVPKTGNELFLTTSDLSIGPERCAAGEERKELYFLRSHGDNMLTLISGILNQVVLCTALITTKSNG